MNYNKNININLYSTSLTMYINCPIKNYEEATKLINFKYINSFYGGVDSKLIFNNYLPLNRRPWKDANFLNLNELNKTIQLIHKKKKKFYLTINEHLYNEKEINLILKLLNKIKKIDGLIVANLPLIIRLNQIKKYKLIGSTGLHIFNDFSISFYKKHNIFNFIIPRHLKINEIKEIVKNNPDCNFECFIMNEDCANIDGLCYYVHGLFNNIDNNFNPCRRYNKINLIKNNNNLITKKKIYDFYTKKDIFSECGGCFINLLKKNGINNLKIVGRSQPLNKKVLDVKFISYIIQNNLTDSIKVKKIFNEIYGHKCNKKCYYNYK